MAKTIDVSGAPMRAIKYLLASAYAFGAVFVASLLCWYALGTLDVAIPFKDGLVWPAVFTVCWIALTVAWVRLFRWPGEDWWESIPREQYLGRFAGGGGLARHSWERAVEQLPDDESEDRER